MSKRTVIVSGGILEKEFVLPILQSEETEFINGVDQTGLYCRRFRQRPKRDRGILPDRGKCTNSGV